MIYGKKVACIIPARLQSSRLPRKILEKLHGKTLLEWVWKAANKVAIFDEIVFAIDAEETGDVIKRFGGTYFMTSSNCKTGTDRLVEIMQQGLITANIWVNWQADEPFIISEMIDNLLQSANEDFYGIWTLKRRLKKEEEVSSPHIAKVVCNHQGYALYFSRSIIPHYRADLQVPFADREYYQHIGMYAYTTKALQEIATIGTSCLEDAECLEQLRFLQHGIPIKIHETKHRVLGIDTPEDLKKAEKLIPQLILNKFS